MISSGLSMSGVRGSGSEFTAVVDVILPVRNYGMFLRLAIESILNQSVKALRLIIVDYGSTDDTLEIAEAFSRLDSRVLIVCIQDGTLVEALNVGCRLATAPLIARQDADDISEHGRLAAQIAVFESRPDVVAVSGSCLHIGGDGSILSTRFAAPDAEDVDAAELPAREPLLLQPFVTYRRSAYLQIGGYRSAFQSYAEDTDLFWRLREVGRLVNLADNLGWMRIHPTSITNASIINGRLIAIYSQLAALSARRRSFGRRDIDFSRICAGQLKKAESLESMLALAARELEPEEARHLAQAAAVKLMELATGRRFELELEDCRFLRFVYETMEQRVLQGRTVANWAYRATLTRLIRKRHVSRLLALGGVSAGIRLSMLRMYGTESQNMARTAG